MPRALLSVTDKSGLAAFASGLADLGWELVSTGGTAGLIRSQGIPVLDVAQVTGFPEMLDGRIKTLHPKVHGGLLGDVEKESHRQQMTEAGIEAFDLAVVNLYAFEATVTQDNCTWEDAIENIDIGGPAMIRAAAKNHSSVAVIVDPLDYDEFLRELNETGSISLATKQKLAAKAYSHTALYDSMISRWLCGQIGEDKPGELSFGYRLAQELRYGENPHQKAALYLDPLGKGGVARASQLNGKELSYNNLLDADAAWELVCDLEPGSVAIIKHGNPCGTASLGSLAASFEAARRADPISAFGGIAACNGVIDEEAAQAMTVKGSFLEVVIGPEVTPEALAIFRTRSGWGANVRVLAAEVSPAKAYPTLRTIRGGVLVQDSDEDPQTEWRVVTDRQPTDEERAALEFAWKIIPHVKSNAILCAVKGELLGTGAGQMNRVQSVRLSLEQAGERAKGAVLASDAFFPFPDSILTAAEAGITAVIQPGGSKKDGDVIAAANEKGIAMIMTGVRHFRH